MPIYEEKLICPLSIRFTQDYIRTTFRDGRQIQTALNAIKVEPGVGQFDLVLRAPFPHIEIMRWRIPRYGVARIKTSGRNRSTEEREHWFTLDNRRLYCLQKVATALWPRRVATVVEILYADPGSIWRKYNNYTHGFCVNLGPSSSEAPTDRFDWRETILPLELRHEDESGVLELVLADDKKRKVDELPDTPDRPGVEAQTVSEVLSGAAPAAQASVATGSGEEWPEAAQPSAPAHGSCITPSTAEGSEDSDVAASDIAAGRPAVRKEMGTIGDDVEALRSVAIQEIEEQLSKPRNEGYVWIARWNTRFGQHLGSLRDFLESQTARFEVVSQGNKSFTVNLKGTSKTQAWQ